MYYSYDIQACSIMNDTLNINSGQQITDKKLILHSITLKETLSIGMTHSNGLHSSYYLTNLSFVSLFS